jgi:hypothetical protein
LTPAPNTYLPNYRYVLRQDPFHSMGKVDLARRSYLASVFNDNPGPGKYNCAGRHQPRFAHSSSRKNSPFESRAKTPGPGSYEWKV